MGGTIEGRSPGASAPRPSGERTARRDGGQSPARIGGADRGALALIDEILASSTPRASEASAPQSQTPSEGGATPDLQTLVAEELARLCERTDAICGVALDRGKAGETSVIAAFGEAASVLASPPTELLDALLSLPQATDLAEPLLARQRGDFAEVVDWCAAASVQHESDGSGLALVVAGRGESEGDAIVRPRALADLEASAQVLRGRVSASRATEEMLRRDGDMQRLDRLSSLGELVAEIAHELRNPMVSLKTFIQLLPERYDDPDFREGFREVVAGELARMERLLGDLLSHARTHPSEELPGGVQLGEELSALSELLRYRCRLRGIDLSIEMPGSLPRARISADAFRQIALNLLLNAIAVTPEGGVVRLHAASSERDGVRGLDVRVDDDGPGIAADLREAIFAPFFTTRRTAAGGLGLAISRRLAEAAGGTLVAEDAPGGGARLRLHLPIG